MEVTSTEIQNNFGAYLKYAQFEDVYITRNGRRVAVLRACEPFKIGERRAPYEDKKPKMTLEEFLTFAAESDERFEYMDGEVVLLASPSFYHQRVVVELVSQLNRWSAGTNCQAVTAPFDVIFQTEDFAYVVQPDVVVICDLENINERGRYHGIPAVVVEVLSESNRSYDMIRKLEVYRVSGVKEYWIANPFSKEIYVYTFNDYKIQDYRVYPSTAHMGSHVLEGLDLLVEQIFS